MFSRLSNSREGHLRQGEPQGDKSIRVGLATERPFILRTQGLRNLPLVASSESAIPGLSCVALGVGDSVRGARIFWARWVVTSDTCASRGGGGSLSDS